MGVATNRIWVDHDGTKHEEAQFHTVVIWGKLAETSAAFLTKGTTVLVEGRIETRSWEDKDGNTRKVTEIIAENIQFGARPSTSAPAAAKPSAPKAAAVPSTEDLPVINLDGDEEDTGRSFTPAFDEPKVEDDDVPF
jgi:single-strand DNA-binding protein